jgi:iron complex outermembrane receptor protein/hemoglobin/transferrin/lactoferrin receptor protein
MSSHAPRFRPVLALLFVLVLPVLTAVPGAAQESRERGEITGTVSDPEGGALDGVLVRVPQLGRTALTTEDGSYRIASVPPGTWGLDFERFGYGSAGRTVTVDEGAEVVLAVVLEPRALELGGLVVTGTPGARDALDAAPQVDAVSQAELKRFRDPSLGATLERTVPGVVSIETGSQAGIPVLRGLSGTRVRVLQNGVGQEFYQYGVRHFPTTSLAETERVEVVRGAASILYGSDALGGAINTLTRRLPTAPEGRLHLGGEVEAQAFSNNDEVAGLLDLHLATPSFGARVGVERRDAGNVHTPDEPTFFETSGSGGGTTGRFGDPKYSGELPFTDFDQWSAYGQVGVRGGFGTAEAFLSHWDTNLNFLLPPGGPAGSEENPPIGLGQNLERTSLTLKGDWVGDWAVVRPTFSYQRALRQALPGGETVGSEAPFQVDLAKDVYTARIEVAHDGGGSLRGTFGAEVVRQDGESRGPVTLEPSARTTNVGLFAFEELPLGRVTLSLGARYDVRRQEADSASLTSDPDLLTNDYSVVSGSAGMVVRLDEGWALAVNAASGFRAPTVFELYTNGVHGGVAAFQRGDPTLEPERSLGGDLGLRARTDRLRGELTGYWNRIRDYIFLENTGETTDGGQPIYQADQTDATIRGVEASAELDVAPWLTLGLEGSLVRGTGDGIEDPEGGRDGPLPLLPADRVGGFVEFRGSRMGRLLSPTLRADLRRTSAKDAAGTIEPFSQFDGTPFGTASTRAYTLVGLEASSVLDLGAVPVSLTVSVTNLFDEAYREFLDTYKGYALSPGRDVALRLSAPLSFNR